MSDADGVLREVDQILDAVENVITDISEFLDLEPTPNDMPAHAEPATFVDAGPEEPWLIQGKRDLQRHFGCTTH